MLFRSKLFRTRPITVLLDKAAPEQGFNQQQFFSFKAVTTDKIHLLNQQGKKVGIVDINASRFPLAEIQDWSWLEGQISVGFRFSFLRRTMNLSLTMARNISLSALQKAQEPPSPPAIFVGAVLTAVFLCFARRQCPAAPLTWQTSLHSIHVKGLFQIPFYQRSIQRDGTVLIP